jgi:hypothetical protein
VAEAFPVVQRMTAPPTAAVPATPYERDLPVTGQTEAGHARIVPLAAGASAPAMALPVQRAPATPSAPARPAAPALVPAPVSERRRAAPQAAPVTVARRSSGGPHPQSESAPDPVPVPVLTTSPGFDARALSDGQVDELTHRLIGPLARLLRTELRLDRERTGRLRDLRR